jgi:predicted dehydrogenase
MKRREVLAGAAASMARVLGANQRIRAAVIGCGNRGLEALLPGALASGAEPVAACDVYRKNLDRGLTLMGAGGGKPDGYSDYRRVLERRDIDVVFVATPDHWHAPIAVAACQAGKDVYVEKPLANDIDGCLRVVAAEAKYRRIVQVGVQQRSSEIYFMALDAIRQGRIGPLKRCSMVWGADGSGPARPAEPTVPVPEGLDWEAFQGSAPRRPFATARQHSWRSYWEYGSGAITDFGVHLLDVTRWFMDLGVPAVTFGAGYHSPSRLPEQVPDVVDLTWRWDRALATYSSRRDEWGNTFWGDGGSVFVNRALLRVKPFGPRAKGEEVMSPQNGQQGTEAHVRNFLECVKSRKQPNAGAAAGSDSTIACLLAALSARTGKSYAFDGRAARAV